MFICNFNFIEQIVCVMIKKTKGNIVQNSEKFNKILI